MASETEGRHYTSWKAVMRKNGGGALVGITGELGVIGALCLAHVELSRLRGRTSCVWTGSCTRFAIQHTEYFQGLYGLPKFQRVTFYGDF